MPVLSLRATLLQGRRNGNGNKTCTANDGGGGGGVAKLVRVGYPSRQQVGMGERCKLPHRGLGRSPRSSTTSTILF